MVVKLCCEANFTEQKSKINDSKDSRNVLRPTIWQLTRDQAMLARATRHTFAISLTNNEKTQKITENPHVNQYS